jgi:hypothetical protein
MTGELSPVERNIGIIVRASRAPLNAPYDAKMLANEISRGSEKPPLKFAFLRQSARARARPFSIHFRPGSDR